MQIIIKKPLNERKMEFVDFSQSWVIYLIVISVMLAVWETVWKLVAYWKAARNNDLVWFICIAIFNTAGILPIIYILTHQKKE